MNEWWLIVFLAGMALLTSFIVINPVRQGLKLSFCLYSLIFISSAVGYYFWGSFNQWQVYLASQQSQAKIETVLKELKSPDELVKKLRAKLDENPNSAKGWYLLGRIYTGLNDFKQASSSFAKAHRLEPVNEQYAVNYGYSLWQLNNQQFNPYILELFQDLLKTNQNQPDALSMLAMHAYATHDYSNAVNYWRRLLVLVPEQSDEAMALKKAINRAQSAK